jgi:hypothetical protein
VFEALGGATAGGGQLLDLAAPHGDDGDLAAGEEAVAEQQQHDDANENQHMVHG